MGTYMDIDSRLYRRGDRNCGERRRRLTASRPPFYMIQAGALACGGFFSRTGFYARPLYFQRLL